MKKQDVTAALREAIVGGHYMPNERLIEVDLANRFATNRLQIGDKIRLVPGHCDPTVNLYDWYVGIRGNRVEQLWPITARGAVY